MFKRILIFFILLLFFVNCQKNKVEQKNTPIKDNMYKGKRVLYIDSYHAEYTPSIIAQSAVKKIFKKNQIELDVVYLDAKREKEDKLKQNALKIKKKVESWKPDAIIVSDDAACKYVIVPFFKNKDIPVVFAGVNWDAEQYGFPCDNVTGQIEVELIKELIETLKNYSKGNRLGIITGDTLTDRKSIKYYKEKLNIHFDMIKYVDSYDNWKKEFINIQNKVDILIFRNNSGIKNWDDEKAKSWVLENTVIPTGSVSTHLYPWVLISFAKMNYEFGEYSANTVLRIFDGTPIKEINVTSNKQAKIYLNMTIAKKMNIKFPVELIEKSTMVK